MNLTLFIGVAVVFLCLALVFHRALGTAEKPRPIFEPPSMPEDLSAAVLRIEKWHTEKRISDQEYERLMNLCRHDAETPSPGQSVSR